MMSLYSSNDALMCKMFPSSLGMLGLLWFTSCLASLALRIKCSRLFFLERFVTSQKQENDIDALSNLGKTTGESLRESADRYWDTLNEIEGCIQYQKVAMTSFKNGLDQSARDAYQDFYLHPPMIWMTS